MDRVEEKVVSSIERGLIGLPSVFSAEVDKEDLGIVGMPWIEDYLTENGYKLNATASLEGGIVELIGSSQEIYHA